jgi:dienelactone hydrolase
LVNPPRFQFTHQTKMQQMNSVHRFGICLFTLLVAWSLDARAAGPATTRAPAIENGWDRHWFDYEAKPLIVEETTPTPDQVDFGNRPSIRSDLPAPIAQLATARTVGVMEMLHLRFHDSHGEDVPVLLCKPLGKTGPFPVVIAVHGVCSNKAQICGLLMAPLARRGFAILALDLPLHGERAGDPRELMEKPDLPRTATVCRQAIIDLRQCIDLAEARKDLDTKHGVTFAGYSLGAIIGAVAGPADDRFKAMLLMAGGVPELPPAFSLLPGLRALSPQLAIPHFGGRPLLMLNGTRDETITRDWADRLFSAAGGWKRRKWYDCGHDLLAEAFDDGAEWLGATWKSISERQPN